MPQPKKRAAAPPSPNGSPLTDQARLPHELMEDVRIVAAGLGMGISEYLVVRLRPIVDADLGRMVEDLNKRRGRR